MIVVVSPHLDDAVLSCADHALRWRAKGLAVRVLTLFTAAGPAVSPVLGLEATKDASTWMDHRRAEDLAALSRLGLQGEHLGLIDAGLRGRPGAPDFPTLSSLCGGGLGPGGETLLARAVLALRERVAAAHWVLSPLGIGGHVDHVIACRACRLLVPPGRLAHYADMPYARAPWRWPPAAWRQVLAARRSWCRMSSAKREAMAAYASQMPLLFRRRPGYPELLLWPRGPAELPGFR